MRSPAFINVKTLPDELQDRLSRVIDKSEIQLRVRDYWIDEYNAVWPQIADRCREDCLAFFHSKVGQRGVWHARQIRDRIRHPGRGFIRYNRLEIEIILIEFEKNGIVEEAGRLNNESYDDYPVYRLPKKRATPASNTQDDDIIRILKSEKGQATRRQLFKRLWYKYTAAEIKDTLESLQACGRVEVEERKPLRGRTTYVFTLVDVENVTGPRP